MIKNEMMYTNRLASTNQTFAYTACLFLLELIVRTTFFSRACVFLRALAGEESGGAKRMKVMKTTCDLVSKREKPPLEYNIAWRGVVCGG